MAEPPKSHSPDAAKKLVADKCAFICELSKDPKLNGSAVKIANLLLLHYLNRKTGDAFRRQVLERGDEEDPAVLFRNFMGRDPDMNALLTRLGIGATS